MKTTINILDAFLMYFVFLAGVMGTMVTMNEYYSGKINDCLLYVAFTATLIFGFTASLMLNTRRDVE